MSKVVKAIRSPFLGNVFVALIYILVAKWSLTFATVHASATAIWPPTGLAITAFLILGNKIWPAIFIGAFVTNITTAGNAFTSLGIALGNTLEGFVGAFLISRFAGGLNAFMLPSWIFRFSIVAGLLAPIVSATIGVGTLLIGGQLAQTDIRLVWLTWTLGNMGGALIVTPLILLWYRDSSLAVLSQNPRGIIIAMALLCFASYLVFSGVFPYAFLTMPVLLYIAFAFTPRETITGVFIVTIIATYATLAQSGPFWTTTNDTAQSLLVLQIFLSVLSITKLTIAVSVAHEREQEALVHQTDRWYKTLIEKSSDAISLIDVDATIMYASPSTEQVLGYTPKEFEGMRGLSLVHPEDLARTVKTLARVVATPNIPIREEFRYKHKDGRWIWVQTTGRNLLHDPTIHAIVINYRDITENKDFEQAKDDFMMIAAHQLRTPVSSIRWNAELLLKAPSKLLPAVRNGLNAILLSTHQMVSLIDELLEMSRVIMSQTEHKIKPFPVTQGIINEIHALSALMKEHKVTVSFIKPVPEIPRIMIDEVRFQRVIQNVLSNAIKYSNPKSTVTISAGMKDKNLVITVSDTGLGIPREDQYKLFTKFFRTDIARRRDPNGKGLGLYAVKQYMDSWGGHVTVTSPTGEGTTGTTVELRFPPSLFDKKHGIKKGGIS